MESAKEFTARALKLQNEAIALSQQRCGDNTELNQWMLMAKSQGMTWVDGLAFALVGMSAPVN